MRVTTNTISSNYLKHLGATAEDLQRSRLKASTLRNYLSVEEAPSAYVREAKITRDYHRNEDYQETADQAMALLQNQDKVLQEILDMSRNLSKKYSLEALSDPSAAQRKIYAAQLESLQEAMVRTLNANDSGDFIFAGADGAKPPFELEKGRLYYRGIDVETGRYKDGTVPDTANGQKDLDMLKEEKLYFDLGYGLDTSPNTAGIPNGTGSVGYSIKDSSAFNASVSGLKAIGWADDNDKAGSFKKYNIGVEKTENIITLAGKLAKMLREYDQGRDYTEFATDSEGYLLYDKDNRDGTYTRMRLKTADTNQPILGSDVEVDSSGFLVNKLTKAKYLKTAPSEYWKESDVNKYSRKWNDVFSETLKKFDAAYDRVLREETNIGVKMNFVSVTKNRLDLSEEVLTERFEQVAKIKPEEAFTELSFAMNHYNTALRIGTSIIPKSLAELMPF